MMWQPVIKSSDRKYSTKSGSISITANPLTTGKIRSVRTPSPGPISNTLYGLSYVVSLDQLENSDPISF